MAAEINCKQPVRTRFSAPHDCANARFQNQRPRPSAALHVASFGAAGDGATDDTAALQRALREVNKGVIYLPAGGADEGRARARAGPAILPTHALSAPEPAGRRPPLDR